MALICIDWLGRRFPGSIRGRPSSPGMNIDFSPRSQSFAFLRQTVRASSPFRNETPSFRESFMVRLEYIEVTVHSEGLAMRLLHARAFALLSATILAIIIWVWLDYLTERYLHVRFCSIIICFAIWNELKFSLMNRKVFSLAYVLVFLQKYYLLIDVLYES